MRSRNIKPGFYANEDLAECSLWARYIFPGLWMMADREGRLEYRPKKIKGELLRFDNEDVAPLLDELQARGFILIYEASGTKYIQVIKFLDHQHPHFKEAESVIPPPTSPGLTPHSMKHESDADDASNECDSEASLGQAQGKPEIDGSFEGGQTRLIPDSGFLIPDSGLPQPKAAKKTRPRKTAMPDGFGISDRVRRWASENGHSNLEAHMDSFRRKVAAKGYEYVDWDSAFMEAVRENWAKLPAKANGHSDSCNPGDARYVN
jgi:hypothetical protein